MDYEGREGVEVSTLNPRDFYMLFETHFYITYM